MTEFRGVDNWFKSAPLKLDELRGKVVLIDFWTYTRSNCIKRQAPPVRDQVF